MSNALERWRARCERAIAGGYVVGDEVAGLTFVKNLDLVDGDPLFTAQHAGECVGWWAHGRGVYADDIDDVAYRGARLALRWLREELAREGT